MRLKKLVIVGFKSFAEKTTLCFDAGVTCIVGPNGCGKSNISDAFRWVLGEQSAKSMRGNKMPDVIFAGTSQRKPLNFAEVSLTLSDIQGALPVDYEEVTITRRLHRNGESEYFLNGHLVRLKDLQSLFLDSGIGRNAFSIFEQGKIDQVINYSPVERRYIFEEAAGILRFLQRKREALKRLEQADLNLDRVKDIYQEVEKQIVILREQAEKAKCFKENQILLEELEKTSYVLRWSQLEKRWLEAEKGQEKQSSLLADLNLVLKQLQIKNQETKELLNQKEKDFRLKNEELYRIRGEKEIHIREQLSSQEYLKEAQQKQKKLKRELEELLLTQEMRQKALRDIQQKQTKIEVDFQEVEGQLTIHQDKVKLKEKEVVQLRQDLNEKQQKYLKLFQNESQKESEWKQTEVRLENNRERKKQLDERSIKVMEGMKQLVQLIQEKKQQLNQMSALVDTYKDRLDQYEDDLKVNLLEIDNKQKEIDLLKRKILEQKARQKVLLKMQEDHEGFSSGSKKLLKESQNAASSFYNKIQPLYEFLKPNSEAVEALTTILRPYAQTLVIDTEKDFKALIAFAKEHKIQDYSLICIEWILKKQITSHLTSESFLKNVVPNPISEHVLKYIREVESNEKALFVLEESSYAIEVWSQDGAFFDRYNVFFSLSPNENHVFMRNSELGKIEEELVDKENQLKHLDKQLQLLLQYKAKLQLERSELDKMLRRDEMKLVEVNFNLQRCLVDQEKIKTEQEQIQKELSELDQQIENQQAFLDQLRGKHLIAKQELMGLQEEVLFLEKEVETHLKFLHIQQQDHKEKTEGYRKLVEDKQQLAHQYHLLESKNQDHQKQELRLQYEMSELNDLELKLKMKGTNTQQFLEKIEANLQQSKMACELLEKELEAIKESLSRIDQEIVSQLNLIRKNEEVGSQLSVQLAQYRSAAQSLTDDLQERYQLSIEQAKQYQISSNKSLEQIEKQIRSLRQALQAAGDVNLTSIEELEKHQVRYEFLNQQMNDMAVSKEELLQIIHQLDTQSRKIFRETFEAIRSNFKKNFQILFNGGEADLQFTETDNILEAGIEISARPPGKQMRSITLLSGGEKCLTAVALLFAIFEVKPSPFCILDEIDAPLDDTNVERFVNVVKHFVDRCQFLIITHNKRTMAIGDVLFGISMEERGVSKVLSLEFSHEAAPEAAIV